ncbi:hypothetical protein LUZ60_007753 [Juncus effusus]|nr:hypothetical protein LUZ60_007753 [Juncus effusus]
MAKLISLVGRRLFPLMLLLLSFVCLFVERANGNVVLVGRNLTISFDDAESAFGPEIEEPGVRGIIYVASPLDACLPLTNQIANNNSRSIFALIMRGGCTFYDKVINAQNSGFKLAIIYDDSYHNRLVTMAGEDEGITIPSIFISRESGESLQIYSTDPSLTFLITPSSRLTSWSLSTIFLLSFLAVCSVMCTCCFIRRRRAMRNGELLPRVNREGGGGMGWEVVRRMKVVVFEEEGEEEGGGEGDGSGVSCVVCLEEYGKGEKLRVLPCRHRFHMNCIDSWLTKWRTFCPICKQDARINSQNPPPSETTPLLTSLNFPPNPSLAHFLPFSNYLSFASRSALAQILRLGPSNSSSFWFSSNSRPSG